MKLRIVPVPGYPGLFAGSDGSVWRYRNYTGKSARWNGWRQPCIVVGRDGYAEVVVTMGEKSNRRLMVHKAVALAFHGERPTGLVITHLDGDKRNNAPANLAYRTHRDNVLDKRAHGTMAHGESHYRCKLTDDQCREILLRLSRGEYATTLAGEYSVSVSTVHQLKSGRTRPHLSQSIH